MSKKEKNTFKHSFDIFVGSFLDAITHGIPGYLYGLIKQPKKILKYSLTVALPVAFVVLLLLFVFN